jgi:tetratricopeptide (TPR) repeat protein
MFVCLALFSTILSVDISSGAEDSQPFLTLEELNAARNKILSHSVDFKKRVELASSVTNLLESRNLSLQARQICLDFYSSISTQIVSDLNKVKTKVDGSPFKEWIQTIEKGQRKKTREDIQQYVARNKSKTVPAAVSLLALKADDMLTAYTVLYEDLSDGKIDAYSNYVLGILYAREKRLVEAERFFEQAQGRLNSELPEKWLALDLTKLALLTGDGKKAEAILSELLKNNPDDVHSLNLKIKFDLVLNKKDSARQQLARIVPLLYEDPYLLAETASYAMQLMEMETAARILETYESKVEPNRDFYLALALLSKHRGKSEEEAKYKEKARAVQDSRVVVGGMIAPSEELATIIEDTRKKQKQQIEEIHGIDPLAKVYLFLLSHDIKSAIEELTQVTQQPNVHPQQLFVLSTLYRRLSQFGQAIESLEIIRANHSWFRPYQVLSLLADYSIHIQQMDKAEAWYQELQKQFPDSLQANVGKRFIENRKKNIAPTPIQTLKPSPFLSRYPQYSAPFVISEIMNFWGNRVTFSTINAQLGTSPRRELQFDELVTVLLTGIPFEVVPFVGTNEVLQDYFEQKIPVIFCEGEMFTSQRLNNVSLITGSDATRGLFYAENVTSCASHLLTESEILEGICIAVYPRSLNTMISEAAKKSAEFGKEYLALNAGAILLDRKQKDFDPKKFQDREKTIAKERSKGFIPHQLAFARRGIREYSYAQARKYLDAIRSLCSSTVQYSFLDANLEFRNKQIDIALKHLAQTMKMNPNTPRYELSWVRIVYMQGKLKEAIEKTEQLRDQYPDNASVSAHLIALYKKAGDDKKKEAEETRLKDLLHIDEIEIDLDTTAAAKEKTAPLPSVKPKTK